MKTNTFICLFFILSFAVACGGDSDSSDEDYPVDVTGVWQGSVTLDEDECGVVSDDGYFEFMHSVTQFDSSVTLRDQGVEYVGHIVGDNGFSVDAPGERVDGCNVIYRYRYDSINHDDDRTAEVRYFVVYDCPDSSCQTSFSGEAIRP